MKLIKILFFSLIISFYSLNSLQASNDTKDVLPEQQLRKHILKLLSNNKFLEIDFQKEIEANLSFVVNKNNEVVILNVDCESEAVKSTLKHTLNYKKLDINKLKINTPYRIKLIIRK